MRAGTYIFSTLCSTTGIPFPLFHILIKLFSLRLKFHCKTNVKLVLKYFLYLNNYF